MSETIVNPKVFISYSWSSEEHKARVLGWAERLQGDGVEVVIDQASLIEGQDKYAFMERMVTDASIKHVIIFSDAAYAGKADARRNTGVGTESQIISAELYKRVAQTKFVPVVCEFKPDGDPCLPVFLASRIYVDFSTPERVNAQWEKLIRLIFDKPAVVLPPVGKPPAYIVEPRAKPHLTAGKFAAFREAATTGRPNRRLLQADYVDSLIEALWQFSLRPVEGESFDVTLLQALREMRPYRDEVIEFCRLLVGTADVTETWETVGDLLEALLVFRYQPAEVSAWNEVWSEHYQMFLNELFVYVVALFLKMRSYAGCAALLQRHYILPGTATGSRANQPSSFEVFRAYSRVLTEKNDRLNPKQIDPVADVFHDGATLSALPFSEFMQADFVCFLHSLLSPSGGRWYPGSLVYSGYHAVFPLFVRSVEHRHFLRLCEVLGVRNKADLQDRYVKATQKSGSVYWHHLTMYGDADFDQLLNLEKLDTVGRP